MDAGRSAGAPAYKPPEAQAGGGRGQLLDLSALRTFYEVAHRGGFSRAAEALHLSQPAVSRQVQALEAALGFPLFAERRRRLRLSEPGRALFAYAERILRLCAEAEEAMREMGTLSRGRVALAASTTPGGYVLPPLLARFARRYPGIEISLSVASSAEVARRVAAGEADVGVLTGTAAGPDCFLQPLTADELVLVAGPDHPLAGKAATADALERETLLMREHGSGTAAAVEACVARAQLPLARRLILGCSEAIKRAAAAGMGIAFLSRWVVAGELGRGELAQIHGFV